MGKATGQASTDEQIAHVMAAEYESLSLACWSDARGRRPVIERHGQAAA